MKILIVPDVHGRTFWEKAKDLVNNVDKVIFLGDYLDPYSHENITREQAINNFKNILEFKKNNFDKVVLLIGNHDSSYIWYDSLCYSRHDYDNHDEIHKLFTDSIDYFYLTYEIGKYLFSHAGVYEEWVNKFSNGLNFLNLPIKDINDPDILFVTDTYRGGIGDTGSPIWADIRDHLNNTLWEEDKYYQVVGHTQLNLKPYIQDHIACLDVRICFLLDTETDKFKEL